MACQTLLNLIIVLFVSDVQYCNINVIHINSESTHITMLAFIFLLFELISCYLNATFFVICVLSCDV